MIRSPAALRPATVGDLPFVVRTLTTAFGEPLRADTWEWLQGLDQGAILVAERRRQIVGTAAALQFGHTGWIGGLGVEPRSRRRGIATALTEAVSDWLRDGGAQTILLQATAQGRPVYERLGFEPEGGYRMFSVPPQRGIRPIPRGARRLRQADWATIVALDAAATGEDRSLALRAAWRAGGLALEDDRGTATAYHLDSPWGPGPTIGGDPASGLALVQAARRTEEAVRIGVPEHNPPAVAALRDQGFGEVAGTERMRLGPPVAWSPDRVFGVFNPFWG